VARRKPAGTRTTTTSIFRSLAWAAVTGLVAVDRRLRGGPAACAIPAQLTALFVAVAFYRPASATFATDAYTTTFLHWIPAQAQLDFGPYGAQLRADSDAVRRAIPAGATISSIESVMPLVYDVRTVYLYPLGIDRADYAIVARRVVEGRVVISGFPSALGPTESAKINAELGRRLQLDGFNLDHPLVVTQARLAVYDRRSP
jgi:hypothetical protein